MQLEAPSKHLTDIDIILCVFLNFCRLIWIISVNPSSRFFLPTQGSSVWSILDSSQKLFAFWNCFLFLMVFSYVLKTCLFTGYLHVSVDNPSISGHLVCFSLWCFLLIVVSFLSCRLCLVHEAVWVLRYKLLGLLTSDICTSHTHPRCVPLHLTRAPDVYICISHTPQMCSIAPHMCPRYVLRHFTHTTDVCFCTSRRPQMYTNY